jgi:hypothetical protein
MQNIFYSVVFFQLAVRDNFRTFRGVCGKGFRISNGFDVLVVIKT